MCVWVCVCVRVRGFTGTCVSALAWCVCMWCRERLSRDAERMRVTDMPRGRCWQDVQVETPLGNLTLGSGAQGRGRVEGTRSHCACCESVVGALGLVSSG